MGRPLIPLIVVSAMAWSGHVAAQSRAERLFNQGLEAFLAGNHAVGCPLIQQSHALEPLAGVLFTLAECQRGWGKFKTANDSYSGFLDAVGQLPATEADKHADRVAVALRKRAEIAAKIPTLTVRVRGELPTGGQVVVDDVEISRDLGRPIPLDPGLHDVRLRNGDSVVATASVDLAVGVNRSIELDSGAASPATEGRLAVNRGSVANTPAWVFGSVGVLGLAVGSATGLMAASKQQTIDDNCPGRVCNAEGRDAVDSAQSLGLVSTVSFGIGVAGISAATYLFLSADASTETPQAGIRLSERGAELSYGGRF